MLNQIFTHRKKWVPSVAMLLTGAAIGFGLGFWLGASPWVGCLESDLTPVPNTEFVSSSSAASTASSDSDSSSSEAVPAEVPKKWVCLTFDDGPSKTTPAVLKALNDAGVHATFFVVATGYNDRFLPLIAEAHAAGHQIALHSASHEYSDIYRSSDAYWADINLLRKRISPYINIETIAYLRFPGGSTNTVSRRYGGKGLMKQLKAEAEEKGYKWVDWNVCAEDAAGGKPDADQIYRNIVRETGEKQQCVVLMHDSSTTHSTAEALPDIIAWYREQGFTFCTVEQILG